MELLKVKSLCQVTDIYKILKSKYKKILTNFPLLSGEMERNIHGGFLQMWKSESEVLFIEDREQFYRLFYMVPKESVMNISDLIQALEKPITCEIIERDGKEKQDEIWQQLEIAGFARYKKYYKYDNDLTLISPEEDEVTESMPMSEAIMDNIKSVFDIFTDQIPTSYELGEYLKERRMILVYREGKYVGAVSYLERSTMFDEDFVYVIPEYKGQGLATVLLNKLLVKARINDGVEKVTGWVEEKNIRSIAVHDKVGFKKTSQYKIIYMKG